MTAVMTGALAVRVIGLAQPASARTAMTINQGLADVVGRAAVGGLDKNFMEDCEDRRSATCLLWEFASQEDGLAGLDPGQASKNPDRVFGSDWAGFATQPGPCTAHPKEVLQTFLEWFASRKVFGVTDAFLLQGQLVWCRRLDGLEGLTVKRPLHEP
jgi:hypothetical protein